MQKGVPQIMDITSIRSVLHYLTENILPTKFETAQQPEPNTIQLCFRGVDSQTWDNKFFLIFHIKFFTVK